MKDRNISMEILRVVAMLMIIIGHFFTYYNPGIPIPTAMTPIMLFKAFLYENIRVFCHAGVPLFIMISGCYAKEHLNLMRLNKLWFHTFLYGVLFLGLFYKTASDDLSIRYVVERIMPLLGSPYWFFTIYFGLSLLSPFLARALRNVERKQFIGLLVVLSLLCLSFRKPFPLGSRMGADYGFSLLCFIYYYCFGFYFGKYNVSLRGNQAIWLIGSSCTCSLFLLLSEYVLDGALLFVPPYSNGISFLVSVVLFLIFRNWNPEKTRVITLLARLAPYTFGVYVIHDNFFIRHHLWGFISKFYVVGFPTFRLLIYALIVSVMVFVAATVLDMLVVKLEKQLYIDNMIARVSEWENKKLSGIVTK